MKIDRSNFEPYLIDYLDGNLKQEDRRQVERFLAANPDISLEYETANAINSISCDTNSLHISNLIRTFSDIPEITDSNFEEFCIAYHEGELDIASREKLKTFIQLDSQKRNLFDLHGKIHFVPELKTQYFKKNQLKKRVIQPVRRYLYIASAGAAALLIGFILFINRNFSSSSELQVIHQEELVSPPAETMTTSINEPASEIKIKDVIQRKKFAGQSAQRQIAAIDTNRHSNPETIILAAADPIQIDIMPTQSLPITETFLPNSATKITPQSTTPVNPSILKISSTGKTRIINRETLFWSAVQAGVKGFNTLTENDLALDTQQNQKGQITELRVQSENFQFQRKFKKNLQN